MLFELSPIIRNSLGYVGKICISNITNSPIRYTILIDSIKTTILKIEGMEIERDNNFIIAKIRDKDKKLEIGKSEILKFSGVGSPPEIKNINIIIDKF